MSRSDPLQASDQHRRMQQCDDKIRDLYARAKELKANDLWLPQSFPFRWQVATIGTLPAARVLQVIDSHNVIAEVDGHSFWLTGVDTSNLVDDKVFAFGQDVWIKGTKQYQTVIGATRTVYLVEPFDVRSHLIVTRDVPSLANVAGVQVDVRADEPWQAALAVRAGDTFRITATGTWCACIPDCKHTTYGPKGSYYAPGHERMWYLRCKVGDGPPLEVDEGRTVTAAVAGNLQFEMYDLDHVDNDGSLHVTVTKLPR